MMDRKMLEEHLARAEQHITRSEQHILRQRQILSELERDGHADAARRARELLAQFEETLAAHVADEIKFVNSLKTAQLILKRASTSRASGEWRDVVAAA